MWQLWSKALEWLGGLRIGGSRRTKLFVGQRDAPDAQGGSRWREYLSAERLYDTWAPAPGSPWAPFHSVPLFAALDRLDKADVGPAPGPELALFVPTRRGLVLPVHARRGAPIPAWVGSETWVILDLPGPLSVEVSTWLIVEGGCQPVCTFDNWPHPKGVLRSEDTLAELLRWASTVDDARAALRPTSPPLWICDNERLGTRVGSPGEFDNRYFLDDSVLPAIAMLRNNGVVRVVYVVFAQQEIPTLDLEPYFVDLLKEGFPIEFVDLADPTLTPQPLSTRVTSRPFKTDNFRRSAAGGFGTEVPEPSSGGSS